MNEKINEFLMNHPFLKFETTLSNVEKPLTKDTPIYITGVSGPQGKTTLKNILIEDGYTNVLELEDVWNECFDTDESFEDKNAEYIKKYKKEGLVINFGKLTLPQYRMLKKGK
jgi:hypothetical protein